MSFPRYETYMPTDIPWMTEIPAGWKAQRLKTLFQLMARPIRDEDEIITAFRDGEVTLRNKRRQEGFTNALQEIGYQGVRRDDLVIHAMDAFAGAIGVSDSDGKSTPVYSVCRPLITATKSKYYGDLLRYMALSGFINSLAKGIRERSTDFRWSDAGNVFVPIPSEQEQISIISFIDHETAKIDALIEEQRRLIELLKEKRQAVISHAVTKGLDPDGEMWDTSIKWIGEIPLSWTVSRVKYAVAKVVDCLHTTPTYDGELSYPAIRTADVEPGRILISQARLVSEEVYRERVHRLEPESGDILYSREGERFGIAALVPPLTKLCLGQRMMMFRPDPSFDPAYLMWAMNSSAVYQQVLEGVTGPTAPHVNIGEVINFSIPAPPLTDQKNISKHIDAIVTQMDGLVALAHDGIGLLEERRSALISAAVTGKIDVRFSMRKGVASVKPYTSAFAHQVLAAKILANCNDSHMGRTKLQKLIHVTEYHAQIEDLRGNYTRKMAGPLNMKAMISLEQGLEKQGWYKTVKSDKRYRYIPLDKPERHSKYMDRWSDKAARIDQVLSLMGNMTMHQCEIVSTLYAAWNDLLIEHSAVTDEAILAQASTAEGWHEKKERTPREKWVAALGWMKKVGLVPTGFGTHTRKVAAEDSHEPA
jgi:type I restriction enzyme S subunit